METLALCVGGILVAANAATLISTLPVKLAWTVGLILAIVAIALWREWARRVRIYDELQLYAPLAALVVGAILGGFWA